MIDLTTIERTHPRLYDLLVELAVAALDHAELTGRAPFYEEEPSEHQTDDQEGREDAKTR